VVRAFLPEASKVEAIGEHGETAALARIHDAGLFAGALPNGSKRYQLRARFGENVVNLDDPYRFPPVLTDFDLYLLGEGTHQRIYDKRRAPCARWRQRRGFRGARPQRAAVSVVGDFTSESTPASDAGAWRRLLVSCPCRSRIIINSTSSAHRPAPGAEIRSGMFAANAPQHCIHCR
jgi:hypothetical protein